MAATKARGKTENEIRDIVWTPNDAVAESLATIETRRTTAGLGVRLNVPCVDQYLLPARPGELVTIIGMSSNYKSGMMQYWARTTAESIVKDNIEHECVVYVTWEQAIEEVLAFDLAGTARLSATRICQGELSDTEMERLRLEYGAKRAVLPLYLVGHSIGDGKRRPRLTLDAVGLGLNLIRQEFDLKPRAIFLDYLQQIDAGEGEDRRMQVFNNVYRCKDMALAMGCPVILGCQAGRQVYRETWGVPTLADGLETSNIEHTSDKVIGIWLPKTTYEVGKTVELKGQTLEVTENLLVLKVLKQRMGPAGRWWQLYVDPATNAIGELQREPEDGANGWWHE